MFNQARLSLPQFLLSELSPWRTVHSWKDRFLCVTPLLVQFSAVSCVAAGDTALLGSVLFDGEVVIPLLNVCLEFSCLFCLLFSF